MDNLVLIGTTLCNGSPFNKVCSLGISDLVNRIFKQTVYFL